MNNDKKTTFIVTVGAFTNPSDVLYIGTCIKSANNIKKSIKETMETKNRGDIGFIDLDKVKLYKLEEINFGGI